MKIWFSLFIFLGLVGCAPPDEKALENALLASLDRPGVYVGKKKTGQSSKTWMVGLSRSVNKAYLHRRMDEAFVSVNGEGAKGETTPEGRSYLAGEQTFSFEFFDRPAIAVVIDDWGHKSGPISELATMPGPINVAVIPFMPHSEKAAETAKRYGHEILVHFPMQSEDGDHQEATTIHGRMSTAEIKVLFQRSLKSVPGASGLNNHQGSLATANYGLMKVLLGEIKKADMYFLDSRTTSKSKDRVVAKEIGLRFARRHVFLDNEQDESYVAGQWAKVVARARKKGEAVAIGHIYPVTLKLIKKEMQNIKDIDFVSVSDLVEVVK